MNNRAVTGVLAFSLVLIGVSSIGISACSYENEPRPMVYVAHVSSTDEQVEIAKRIGIDSAAISVMKSSGMDEDTFHRVRCAELAQSYLKDKYAVSFAAKKVESYGKKNDKDSMRVTVEARSGKETANQFGCIVSWDAEGHAFYAENYFIAARQYDYSEYINGVLSDSILYCFSTPICSAEFSEDEYTDEDEAEYVPIEPLARKHSGTFNVVFWMERGSSLDDYCSDLALLTSKLAEINPNITFKAAALDELADGETLADLDGRLAKRYLYADSGPHAGMVFYPANGRVADSKEIVEAVRAVANNQMLGY